MAEQRKISKSLQETVDANKHIDQVHFDALGRHWLNVHEYKKIGPDKGKLFGHIARKHVADKNGTVTVIETPTQDTKIVESIDRDKILELEPVSDLLINMNSLTPEEQRIIEKMRAKKS